MTKFILILFLYTPGHIEFNATLKYDTLEQCRVVGNIAVSWRSNWTFVCRQVVYI